MTGSSRPRFVLAAFAAVCLLAVGATAVLAPGAIGAVWDGAVPSQGAVETPDGSSAGPSASPTPATGANESGTAESNETPANGSYRYTAGEGATALSVTVVEAERPGPTVVVVGGQHGNEQSGYRSAHRIENWDVERGTLVVIPEANPRAIANGTRKVEGRDLNAQFPVGERPTSEQARVVWGVVERHDADVVVDLHSSSGIYGVDGGVGQAVFPTVTGPAKGNAEAATRRVNDEFGLTGNHSFKRGNVMGRSGMSLTRKVAGDLNESAYVVETTKRGTDLEIRVEWTTAVTWELLRLHGLVEGERPSADSPSNQRPPTSQARPSVSVAR
ncbi:succinylglutamate desuccinylase/aspartoacylase family protein [Halorarum halophilum]|uniref:Succinylglutamate desuccinylase/aspartoacylase family protein n=1 Tax=Halorarum halophilum TaxID=2743090 RepID=A0A7D5K6F7_9EURY|nr:succinylglutamate desuccinylase/aspartoacylase family protein [Halobaculum halophilum]QLG26659.1 succinylglutamate desuccinylase/aspartoacylase family protein [Halobaculum halophilum]